jgi:hypothetical protein
MTQSSGGAVVGQTIGFVVCQRWAQLKPDRVEEAPQGLDMK